jgi:hypothetical protein
VAREAEVSDLEHGALLVGAEQQVLRLQVAVDEVVRPEEVHAARELAHEAVHAVRRQRAPLAQQLVQVAAAAVLHQQVDVLLRFLDLVQLHDVLVLDLAQDGDLGLEVLLQLGVEALARDGLDGDGERGGLVVRLVHLREGSRPDLLRNHVVADRAGRHGAGAADPPLAKLSAFDFRRLRQTEHSSRHLRAFI